MATLFLQIIHDTVTLKTGKKFLAAGIAFVDPWLESNVTVTLGFVPVSSSKASAVCAALDKLCLEMTGYTNDVGLCSPQRGGAIWAR